MKHLGIDVHCRTSVWSQVDEQGAGVWIGSACENASRPSAQAVANRSERGIPHSVIRGGDVEAIWISFFRVNSETATREPVEGDVFCLHHRRVANRSPATTQGHNTSPVIPRMRAPARMLGMER